MKNMKVILRKRLPGFKFNKEIIEGKVDSFIINRLKNSYVKSDLYKELKSLIHYQKLKNYGRDNIIADLYKYFNSNKNETYNIDNLYDYILYDILYSNYYMQALQFIIKDRSELATIIIQYIASNLTSKLEGIEESIQKIKLDIAKGIKRRKKNEFGEFNGYDENDIKEIEKRTYDKIKQTKLIIEAKNFVNKTAEYFLNYVKEKIYHRNSLTGESIIEIEKMNRNAYEYLKNKMKNVLDNKILNKVNTITGKIISSVNVGEVIPYQSNRLEGYDSCLSDDTGTLFALKYINEDFINKEKKGSREIDVYLDFSGSMTEYLDKLPKLYYVLWIYVKLKKYFNVKKVYLFATRVGEYKDKRNFLKNIKDIELDASYFMSFFQTDLNIGFGTNFYNVYKSIKSNNRTAIIVSDMDANDTTLEGKSSEKIMGTILRNKAYFIKLGSVMPTIWEKIFTGIYYI